MKSTRNGARYRKMGIFNRFGVLGAAAVALIGMTVFPAGAAVLNPGCTAGALIDAINDANGNGVVDTINLPAGCTITLTAVDNTEKGRNGLPSIISEIVINGNGGVIQRDPAAVDDFRIFQIAASGDLTLNNVTVKNGSAPGIYDPVIFAEPPGEREGAGIHNLGRLTINNTTITQNENDFGGGGIYMDGVSMTITGSTISQNSSTDYGGGGIRCIGGITTITDTTISGNESDEGGAGININNGDATVTIAGCTITDNHSSGGGGGGVSVNDGDAVVTIGNTTISQNTSVRGGGGVAGNEADSGSLTIIGCTITDNQAGLSGSGGGGGVSLNYSDADFVRIENTTISGNIAYASGGGISHNNDSTEAPLTIVRCTISNNETGKAGGGVSSVTSGSTTLSIVESSIRDNRATGGGGGVHTNSLFDITGSTFSGNIAGYNNPNGDGGGGGINFIDSDAVGTVFNSTFYGNEAGYDMAANGGSPGGGGGVRNGGTVNFVNCTFAANTAPTGVGGGIYVDGGTTNLSNTIVAGSLAGGNCSGTLDTLLNNLSDDATCGFGDGDNVDPMLGALASNGGPTETCALLEGSPAINAGDNTAATGAGLTTDQRGSGYPRIVDVTVDIGAYEKPFNVPVYTLDTANILEASVDASGFVDFDKPSGILTHGIVWTTAAMPSIALHPHTSEGQAVGEFTSTLTGLAPGTTYNYRAYARVVSGVLTYTFYGETKSFTTAAPADSDGDGMPDAWEDANGLDKTNPNDAGLDPDGDGRDNVTEYNDGTDPNNGCDCFIAGDVNGDGARDLADAMIMLQIVVGVTPDLQPCDCLANADLTGDSRVGIEDVLFILQEVSGLRGDAGPTGPTSPTS